MNQKTDPAVYGRAQANRAEELLRRYPSISVEESVEVIHFLKHGQFIEVGRVTAIPELRNNLDAFRQEHRRAFSLGVLDYIKFMLISIVPIALLVWFLWPSGTK